VEHHRAIGAGPVAGSGSVGVAERSRPILIAHCLGRFAVAVDGRAVDTTSSRRTRNILAYLLTHRRTPVPRDVLMDVFWPRATPESARNSLHVALNGVRRALRAVSPEPILERRGEAYQLAGSATVWVDAEAFERACEDGRRAERAGALTQVVRSYEAAAQLYDGDFLADDPYADWAAATRETLRMQAVQAQSRLVDLYAAHGNHMAATLVAQRLLTIDPCNESVHRKLMISYAGSGQTHLGLAQYHRCVEAMQGLGLPPSRQTTELYERLRITG
jgi:DNA-binding SARP family transcriptional activator